MIDSTADLSLVLPAYNEETRLPAALARLDRFARDRVLAVDLVVVDDGSTDRTVEVCGDWMARHTDAACRIRLISITHRGKGAAVRAGMRQAGGRVVGYCDVDLSAGEDAIADLLRSIRRGAHVAIASRALPGSVLELRQPWYREGAGRCFNAVLRRIARIPFKDTQCGLKLFRPGAARAIFGYQRVDGFAFDVEVVLLAMKLGLDIAEVPVRWSHAEGSKLSFAREAWRMTRDTVRIVRRVRRMAVQNAGVPSEPAMQRMATAEGGHWWYLAKRQLVAAQMSDVALPGRCLDLGCGSGAMLRETSGRMSTFGVDLSGHALDHAQSRGLSRLVRADAASLPLASESFSLVLALDVLEHHPQPEQLLHEIVRILEPDGRLIVTVPAFQWMWSYADDVLGHYRRYTRSRLVDELAAAGFCLHRASYFHAWLLPVAWPFRRLKAFAGQTETSDDFELPGSVNRTLLALSRLELRYLREHDLPFGLSILAVARRASVTPARP